MSVVNEQRKEYCLNLLKHVPALTIEQAAAITGHASLDQCRKWLRSLRRFGIVVKENVVSRDKSGAKQITEKDLLDIWVYVEFVKRQECSLPLPAVNYSQVFSYCFDSEGKFYYVGMLRAGEEKVINEYLSFISDGEEEDDGIIRILMIEAGARADLISANVDYYCRLTEAGCEFFRRAKDV